MREKGESVIKFEKMLKEGKEYKFNIPTFGSIMRHYKKNKAPDKAYIAMNLYKKQYPDSIELLILEGAVFYSMEMYEQAIEVLHRAEHYYPLRKDMYSLRSKCYRAIQEPAFATKDLHKSEHLEENYMEKYEKRKGPYFKELRQKMIEMDPKEVLREEREKFPSEFETLKYIYSFFDSDRGPEQTYAIDFFRKLAEDNPASFERRMYCGYIYRANQMYVKAIEEYTAAVALEPENSFVYNALGNVYSIINNHEETLSNYLICIQYFKPTDYKYYLPTTEEAQEDILGYYYYSVGRCYMSLNQAKEAEYAFRKYAEVDATNPNTWSEIGEALMKQRLFKEALPYYKKSYDFEVEDNTWQLPDLAFAYFKAGDIKKATKYFAMIDAEFFVDEHFYYTYPLFLWDTGNKTEALKVLEKGIKDCPYLHNLFYLKAAFMYCKKDKDNGIKALKSGLKLNSTEYHLLFDYAPELEGNKEIMKVIEDFRKEQKTKQQP